MGGYLSRCDLSCDLSNINSKECCLCKQYIDDVYDIYDICKECKSYVHHKCFVETFRKDGTRCPNCGSIDTIQTLHASYV